MAVNLEYYRTFYHVASLGSMGKAADVMQLTPPTITKTIQTLERQLNCQLFARTSKGVRLTEAGEILYARVKPGLFLLDSGEYEVNQLNALEGGAVRIAVSESAAFHPSVSAAVTMFCSRYPKIKLTMKHLPGDQMRTAIRSGDVDFAIFSISNENRLEGWDWHEIAVSDNVPVVSSKYRDYIGRSVSLAELDKLPLIFVAYGFDIRAHYTMLYQQCGFDFAPAIEMPTLGMQIQAVKLGLGYSFVPRDFVQDDIKDGTLSVIDLKEENVFRRTICLLASKEIPLSRAAQVFADILIDPVKTWPAPPP